MLEAAFPRFSSEQPRVYVGMRNWHPFIGGYVLARDASATG